MRRILPIAVVFVALAALTAWRESQRPSVGTVAEAVGLVQIARAPFTPEQVAAIEVEGPGSAGFTLTRSGNDWSVDRPFRAAVAKGPVRDLLAALGQAQGELRSEDPGAHARFHVSDDSAVAVRVKGKDETFLVDLLLGRSSGRTGAFVRAPESDAVYSVAADLRGLLGLPATRSGSAAAVPPSAAKFHDVNLPAYDVSRATRMVFQTPDRRAVFEQQGGKWAIAEGAPRLTVLVDGLKRTRDFVGSGKPTLALADPAAVAGLTDSRYRLEITFPAASGTPRTVSLVGAVEGAPGRERYFARLDGNIEMPTVYELSATAFALLFPSGDALLDLGEAKLQVLGGGLGRVDVQHPERAYVLSREFNGARVPWRVESPHLPLAEDTANVEKIEVLLRSFRPIDWVDGVQAGPPELTVRFGPGDAMRDELRILTVHGAPPSGRHRMAKLPDLPQQVFVVNQSVLDGLTPRPFDFYRTRLLPRFPRIDVKRVAVRPVGGQEYAVVRGSEPQEWSIEVGGDAEPANRDAVVAWLERLLPTDVTSVVDGDFEPVLTLELEHRNRSTVRLDLAAADEDGYRPVRKKGVWFRAHFDDAAPDPETLKGE